MADNSIVVGFEWEAEPSNQSLSLEKVGCKNV